MPKHRFITGDAKVVLAAMPADSVHCVVTSPPYWGLRDYGVPDAIGCEPTVQEYVTRLCDVLDAVKRVLRPDGTLWLNLGDSYSSSGGKTPKPGPNAQCGNTQRETTPASRAGPRNMVELASKQLVGVPWRVAFECQRRGWYLRDDIVWHKPNPMPESVEDRPTRAHEFVFLFTKSPSYYYDADAVRTDTAANLRDVWTISVGRFKGAHFAVFPEALVEPCVCAGTSEMGVCGTCGMPSTRIVEKERVPTRPGEDSKVYVPDPTKKQDALGKRTYTGFNARWREEHEIGNRDPQRHVTTRRTTGWKRSECPHGRNGVPGGELARAVVLDPFAGSGTVACVAERLGRDSISIDLNAEYTAMAVQRLRDTKEVLRNEREKHGKRAARSKRA